MGAVASDLGSHEDYLFSNMYRIQAVRGKDTWLCGLVRPASALDGLKTAYYRRGEVTISEGSQSLEACNLNQYESSHGFRASGERFYTVGEGGEAQTACGHIDTANIRKFDAGGSVTVQPLPLGDCAVTEKGELNGISYEVNHGDDSGRFYNESIRPGESRAIHWVVNCKTDDITDVRSCTMRREGFFLYWQDGYSILTTGTAYPGSSMHFRVDSNPALSAREDIGLIGGSARQLIAQMQRGTRLVTRYTDWPYNVHKDTVMPTNGFSEALSFMKHIR